MANFTSKSEFRLICVLFLCSAICFTSVRGDDGKKPTVVNNNKFLKELHDSFLELLNKERDANSLTHIVMDASLTTGAQQWADESGQNLQSASSCENEEFNLCSNFTELYAMRRATRSKMAVGKAAAEWLWKTWFSNPDTENTPIPQNVLVNIMGLGVSYVTAPDKSNHVYAVARFAEVDPETYFQDKKLHEVIYFPDEVDITKNYKDNFDYSKTPKHEGAGKGRGIGAGRRMGLRRKSHRKYQTKNSGEDEGDAKSEE